MAAKLKVYSFVIFNSLMILFASSAPVEDAYVTKTAGGEFQIKLGFSNNFVAKASFANGINETGYGSYFFARFIFFLVM